MTRKTLTTSLIATLLTGGVTLSAVTAEEPIAEPTRLQTQWQTVPGPKDHTDKAGQIVKLGQELVLQSPEAAPLRAYYTDDGRLVLSHEISRDIVERQFEEPK